jgi:hypothetical protein
VFNPLQPSGHYIVPPCLIFSNSTFCPHNAFMCFVWMSEQTAIICLCIINRVLCKTESSFTLSLLWTALLRTCMLNLELANSKRDPSVFRQRRSDSVLTEVGSWVSGGGNRRQDAHTANYRVALVWTFSWRRIEVAEANTIILVWRYKEQDKWPTLGNKSY